MSGKEVSKSVKVSIIIPVYNTEKYLRDCIESIINQTISEIEIILVDDGSTDGSPMICDDYSKADERIVVIHKKNGGLSSARNAGFNIANGEYIGFVDSDDYVSIDMFELMYNASQKFSAEIVSCGYKRCNNEGKVLAEYHFPIEHNKAIDHNMMIDIISEAHKSRFIWFVWRNIYKRLLLKNNHILFNTEIRFAEDSIFNLYAFYHAERMISIDKNLYFYRENPDSLTLKKGKLYLEPNLTLQYEEKIKFYTQYLFAQKALLDLKNYIVEHQIPMLLQNDILISKNHYIEKIKGTLNLQMIRESLIEYKLANLKQKPIGIKIIIILCRFRLIGLLGLFLRTRTYC